MHPNISPVNPSTLLALFLYPWGTLPAVFITVECGSMGGFHYDYSVASMKFSHYLSILHNIHLCLFSKHRITLSVLHQ